MLEYLKLIWHFLSNPKKYIIQFYQLLKYLNEIFYKLEKKIIIIITIIICFIMFVLIQPRRLILKSFGAYNLQKNKACAHIVQDKIENGIVITTNLFCIKDLMCIFTIYGDKINFTIEENQSMNGNHRSPLIVFARDNITAFKFAYKLFNYQVPSPVCKVTDIKNFFACNKNTLYNDSYIKSDSSGYWKDLYHRIFSFDKTKEMESIGFHVAQPVDKITRINNRSIWIILNHNDFTNMHDKELDNILTNRIQLCEDPESINYFITGESILNIDKMKYNFQEFIVKINILFGLDYPVRKFSIK